MQSESTQTPITVLTVLEILRERKWFFLIACIVGFSAGLGISYLLQPTYESSVNLEVGKVWGSILEAPQEVCDTILSEAFLQKIIEKTQLNLIPKELERAITAVPTKDIQKRVLSIAQLSARSRSPETCVVILKNIVSLIEEEHNEMYEEWMAINTRYEKELETRISAMKTELEELKNLQFDVLKGAANSKTQILHLEGYIEERETSYLDLLEAYHEVNSHNHSRFYSRQTRVRYPPPLPTEPISPHKLLNAFAGLVLGFLCALAWGSYKKLASPH